MNLASALASCAICISVVALSVMLGFITLNRRVEQARDTLQQIASDLSAIERHAIAWIEYDHQRTMHDMERDRMLADAEARRLGRENR